MSYSIAPIGRAAQSSVPRGSERTYTLVILVNDRPGAVDRVIGLLRRRRASTQALVLVSSELPGVIRVTAQVTDLDVAVDHLLAQLRKVIDVRRAENLTQQQIVTRELALIKVSSSSTTCNEIIECGRLFGAHIVDNTPETVLLEVTANKEKVDELITLLEQYGICELARSGSIAIARQSSANMEEEISL
ncbi:MAG: acetolactate synthase small subunit [Ktedonobacteraceae bacterium]|nr:acetolactate synthase small subunit [Ktedonobacteraceae bacterium]